MAKYSILLDAKFQTEQIQKELNKLKNNIKFDVDTKDGQKSVEDLSLTFQQANLIMQKSIDIMASMVDQVYELDSSITEFII